MKKQKSILDTIEDMKIKKVKRKNALNDFLSIIEDVKILKTDSVRNQEYEKAAYTRNLENDINDKIMRVISFIKKEKNKIHKL